MFWPSTCADGEFFFDHMEGPELDPNEYLAMYDDWQDTSTWPRHPEEKQPHKLKTAEAGAGAVSACQVKNAENAAFEQADPLDKPGIIGAFCRTYDPIDKAIDAFLLDVYAPSDTPDRYDYIPGESADGVVVYDDRFIYSYHATDPLHDMLLNAFDLVQLHKFGDLDAGCSPETPSEELPSFKRMIEFAHNDERVKALLEEEQQKQIIDCFDVIDDVDEDDDIGDNVNNGSIAGGGNGNGSGSGSSSGNSSNSGNSWMNKLERDKNGAIKATLPNLLRILTFDTKLQAVVYNSMEGKVEANGKLPWEHPEPEWRDADDAQLVSYVNTEYASFSAHQCHIALTKVADDRFYHPVKEYIKNLPAWDGTERVDTLLIEYLGAEDSKFTRAVTRKTLCAAISRIQDPGCKFDAVLTLVGPQGVGKSTLIAKLGGKWFSDSLSFNDIQNKTAAEKLQGTWIMEIGELVGLKKTEVQAVRSFITIQDDRYRAAYAKRVTSHKRQCIFIGTTNAMTGFLQNTTGNRRFWPVKTPGGGAKKSWDLTEEEIKQIWAEVLTYVAKGESLYLDDSLKSMADEAQRDAMESDEREGLVQMYLEKPLPDNWDDMDIIARMKYLILFPN